jgi:hypothetical protein
MLCGTCVRSDRARIDRHITDSGSNTLKNAISPLSPLAEAIYEILRQRIGRGDPRITYKDLAAALRDFSEAFEYAHHRNPQLYAALGEIGRECRRARLPPMPALVVRADTRRPGDAYYSGKRSRIAYKDDKVIAWRRDLEAVKQATYPPRRFSHANRAI